MKYITTADFIKQLLDHTASRAWEEIAPMEWTTTEMVDQVSDLLLMQFAKRLPDEAAAEHHGEFANLNVIEGGEE